MSLSRKTIQGLTQTAVLAAITLTVYCLLLIPRSCFAQGPQHYNSPLYSPKGYEDDERRTESNGMPPALNAVGIEQRLGVQLPLGARFADENGREVELKEYFGKKPIIVAFVYYECPMLCNEVLNGLASSLKGIAFSAGKEFDVVAISFNAKETPELAKAKKESYLARYSRPNTENGWHFLTGSQEEIDKATNAAGFAYQWDEKSKQFAHAGGIMVATPEGKLSHYFYGIEYAPKEVRLGLIEASNNKIGNPVDQLLLYCYHYDPSTGKYGLVVMRALRVAGFVTIIGLAAMVLILWRFKGTNEEVKTEKMIL